MKTMTNREGLEALILEDLFLSKKLDQIVNDIYESTLIQGALLDLDFNIIYDFLGENNNVTLKSIQKHGRITPEHLSDNPVLKSRLLSTIRTRQTSKIQFGPSTEYLITFCPAFDIGTVPCILLLLNDHSRPELVEGVQKYICDLYKMLSASDTELEGTGNSIVELSLARELLSSKTDLRSSLFWELYGGFPSIVLTPGYMLAVFTSKNASVNLEKQKLHMEKEFPNTVGIFHNGEVISLFYGITSPAKQRSLLLSIGTFLKDNDLACGISLCFDDLYEKNGYINQAKLALKYGIGQGLNERLYNAEDLFAELIVCSAVNKLGKEALIPLELKRIIEYDAQYHTDYLKSLEVYLSKHNRLADTSRAMFLDRSTIKYRLNKINAIAECDCDDPETAKRLRYAIMAYNTLTA